MKFLSAKTFLAALVFILTVTPNACLVEQVIATIANLHSHGHHQSEGQDHHAAATSHKHDEAAPSHKHDEEEHEEEFCCDSTVYFYLKSKSPQTADFFEMQISISPVLVESEVPENYYSSNFYFTIRLRQPLLLRTRDKYVRSCLLHAPPLV